VTAVGLVVAMLTVAAVCLARPAAAYVPDQQIAVPSYIHPIADPGSWDRLINSSSGKVGIAVANVLNGPDNVRKEEWANVISRAHNSGKRVLGYVDTGYMGLTGQRTRLGLTGPENWMAQIQQDSHMWYSLYGDWIDGIFFDQGYNECGPNNEYATWYDHLNQCQKRHHPGSTSVLNPGAPVPQCYENTADILATFESDYLSYIGQNTAVPVLNYRDPGWVPARPDKIWHIVYDTKQNQIDEVLRLSRERNAGFVYITDDVMVNPYDVMPNDGYWATEQAGVTGGVVPAEPTRPNPPGYPAPATPGDVRVVSSDFTSARVAWSPSSGASSYYVYVNGQPVANVPGSMTSTTIGSLAPGGRTYRMHVVARGGSGHLSPASAGVTVTTATLPEGQTVTNPRVTSGGGTVTYSADFLVPYSFRRVFIRKSPGSSDNCWWTSSRPARCVQWVIENSTLLRYAGGPEGTAWAWTPVATVIPEINGYTYSWTVRAGDVGNHEDDVLVSAEGWAPLTYVSPGSPDRDGQGFGPGRWLQIGVLAVAGAISDVAEGAGAVIDGMEQAVVDALSKIDRAVADAWACLDGIRDVNMLDKAQANEWLARFVRCARAQQVPGQLAAALPATVPGLGGVAEGVAAVSASTVAVIAAALAAAFAETWLIKQAVCADAGWMDEIVQFLKDAPLAPGAIEVANMWATIDGCKRPPCAQGQDRVFTPQEYYPLDRYGRATGAFGMLTWAHLGLGEDATKDPPGYRAGRDQLGLNLERGHLIGKALGGRNLLENLTPLYRETNYPAMYVQLERPVEEALKRCEEVNYSVEVHYAFASPDENVPLQYVPNDLRVRAQGPSVNYDCTIFNSPTPSLQCV
jgi:hypothetical protein